MARATLLTLIAVVAAVMTIGLLLASGGDVSLASHGPTHGDLLLDDPTMGGSNTATSLGTIQRQLCNVALDSTVTIDVVAVDAEDWAAMDFVIYYPSPILVERPGPDDGVLELSIDPAAGFDFVILDTGDIPNTFGPQNFLAPDSSDSNDDYTTTEGVPDGSSPHGVSMFDNSLNGNTGSGGMARIRLDTTNLPKGEYTLLLGKTTTFGGGVHSDASGFVPDNFGAFTLAIDQACSTDTDGDGVSDADEDTFGSNPDDIDSIPESVLWLPEYSNPNPEKPPGDIPPCSDGVDNDGNGLVDAADPACGFAAAPTATSTAVPTSQLTPTSVAGVTSAPTPTATIPVPATGGPPTSASGDGWLILLYIAIAGGVTVAMATAGAVSWRLRRRAAKAK